MDELLFRIIIVGDSGVGKSCIMLRMTGEQFPDSHKPTIGVEFGNRILTLYNQQIKVQFWDTAGQEGYRSITRSFYRSADGVFIVYDCASKKSFNNCEFWLNEIRNNSAIDIMVHLLGNQIDLQGEDEIKQKEVDTKTGEEFAKINCLHGFSEISAKNGDGIEDALIQFCKVLYDKWKEKNELMSGATSRLELNSQIFSKPKKKCC